MQMWNSAVGVAGSDAFTKDLKQCIFDAAVQFAFHYRAFFRIRVIGTAARARIVV